MAGGVEDESEGVVWGCINTHERDNVRVRELGEYPHLSEISLGKNVNRAVREEYWFLTRKIRSTLHDS